MKKVICLILVLCLLLCGCRKAEPEVPPVDTAYSVTVRTLGGMAMPAVQVYIYEGSDLKAFGQTDEAGLFTATLPENSGYTVKLESVPRGYEKAESYAFTGTAADIRLESRLIEDSLSGATLGVGDVMYDFTVMTADGAEVTLSQMLSEKDMVLINFFYTTCGPCVNEFPFLQEAYEEYADSVGVIALDPLDEQQTVALFQSSMGLTFPMAACQPSWSQTFNVPGYPTSIVVDRYGVICLMEVGGITSLRPFTTLFETMTGENYTQKLYGSLSEMLTNVKPTFSMESQDVIEQVLDTQVYGITYRPETEGESAEYAWPFISAEKGGVRCMKATNQGIESSYAILYADVPLEAGQAVSFDYLASSEKGCDVLYVIVDGQDVLAISGWDEEEKWQTCCPWVAEESRTYEVALCYLKDGDTNEADDTVYIANLRVIGAEEIDTPTYIPRQAAVTEDGFAYTYCDIYLSEQDGCYHVGAEDGPLLLVDMMNYTQFSEESTLWDIVYNSSVEVDGVSLYDAMVHFFSYASNSADSGVTPVTQTLREYLEIVDSNHGFDDTDPSEWLKLCFYYAPYGTDAQLENPCAGLCTDYAYEAKLGKNVASNYFYYDRPIMPRGLIARFTPTKSGVYKISSRCDSENGVDAWIFTGDDRELSYTYAPDQRMQEDVRNCSMYYYMEAGQDYYIDIAFWDIYEVGYIYYDIEYVSQSYELFRLASPGYFTYDTNATGEHMYDIIAGGIDVVLGEDGIYYEDLGNGETGSKLYCDFTGITGIFSDAIATVQAYGEDGKLLYGEDGQPVMRPGLIDKGGFDFSKTENDQYVLTVLAQQDNDPEKADEYLRTYWGEDYETLAEEYQLEDVFAGKYHGSGEDYTEAISAYLDRMITSGASERRGCVVVTEELAQLLQMLMDKFTFQGVDHSWTKLCYYYDYLGPEN